MTIKITCPTFAQIDREPCEGGGWLLYAFTSKADDDPVVVPDDYADAVPPKAPTGQADRR